MTWNELEKNCSECQRCALCRTRTNVVFGDGNRSASLMFVGEAPGADEDASGIPFVGRAGKLLDSFLGAVGIPRESVFIANILKCRPPQNRDPLPQEEDMCIDFLREQVRLINPKMIVCLGRISAMRLIKPDFAITREHGKWFKKGKYEMCAVYHPSYLLRSPSKKEDMLADMKMIAQRLAGEEEK